MPDDLPPHSAWADALNQWQRRPLRELIRHIVETHHAGLRAALPGLQAAISEVTRGAPPASTGSWRATSRLLQSFRTETENHLRKEEAVLFPLIEQLEAAVDALQPAPRHRFGTIADLIAIMEQEHRLTDHQLGGLRAFMDEATVDRRQSAARMAQDLLGAIERDMIIHTRLEDDILFPRVVRLESS